MRYSLQERFIGAYFASVISEELSMGQIKRVPWFSMNQEVITQIPVSANQYLSWENLQFKSAELASISEMALAILPIILYYHDNLSKLESLIYQTAQFWQIPLSKIDGILWWSAAISLILREKLAPENLWKQISITSKIFKNSFQHNLDGLQSLCDRGLSITEVTEKLSLIAAPECLPFLISLYCFYQTPENSVLTIKQASIVKNRVPRILALTGFLSGAYNTRMGLPINWEKFSQNGDNYQKAYQLGSKVFALWSGINVSGKNIDMSAIIATPRTLQNRPGLTIISQKEYESKSKRV